MHTYIHTLRSDDGRTPRFRDPMARLVLVCEMISRGKRPEGRAQTLFPKKIDYSGISTLSHSPAPLPQAQCRGPYVHPG